VRCRYAEKGVRGGSRSGVGRHRHKDTNKTAVSIQGRADKTSWPFCIRDAATTTLSGFGAGIYLWPGSLYNLNMGAKDTVWKEAIETISMKSKMIGKTKDIVS